MMVFGTPADNCRKTSKGRRMDMPYVNIRITKDKVTPEKKAELIRGVTALLRDVLGKNPQTTFVVIDEVDTDNWGLGGESITERRKKTL